MNLYFFAVPPTQSPPGVESSGSDLANTALILILLVVIIAQFACFAYTLHRIKLAIAELVAFVTHKDENLGVRFRALLREESRLDGTQITSADKKSTLSTTVAPEQRHFDEYDGISDEVFVLEDEGDRYSPFDGYRTASLPDDYGSAKERVSSECIESDNSV